MDTNVDKSTEKSTGKSGKSKAIIGVLLIIIIVAGLGVGYYFYYQSTHFFKTENASIKADTITITPLMTGKVLAWDIREGDSVTKDQIIGRQDTSGLISSSAINVQDLNNSAASLVEKSMIKAPIDAQVIKSYVVEGETVSPGMELAVLANLKEYYISANIEETEIFKIKVGQKVDVAIDAYPGKKFFGYVNAIGFASQSAFSTLPSLNTSGTFSKTTQLIPVKINLINDEGLPMLLGMNTTVKIHLAEPVSN